jgi:hypothetical protein
MSQLTGGCLCGAVRYTTASEPLMSVVCHCRDCQKFTGSAFGALTVVPKDTVTFTGTMKTFTAPGGSGKPVVRHFCPECGSSIAEEVANAPGAIIFNIGTLDDPKSFMPKREIFLDDALPWLETKGEMPRFARSGV